MTEDYGMLFVPEKHILLKVYKDEHGLWVDASVLGYAVKKLYIEEKNKRSVKST